MTPNNQDLSSHTDDPKPHINPSTSTMESDMAALKISSHADQSIQKRKAERNRRKKLNAKKNRAEKSRQAGEEH
ncbi:hypothetical protein NHQ30_003556 [Ciborinia camelliae]|nr:hypothetical protein NHQ30_003556 [Ciborinia camelliae]